MNIKAITTRASILKEFDREIYLKGYNRTTLKSICDNLGISTGHLYYYFKKKDDLYISLFRDFILKVFFIINKHMNISIDELEKTLVADRFTRFMNMNIPELKVVHNEIVNISNIISGTAQLFSDFYIKGLKSVGFDFDYQTVVTAQQAAIGSEYAVKKLGIENIIPEHDDEYYSDMAFKVFFSFLDVPADIAQQYIEHSREVHKILDRDYMVAKVYELSTYDFSEQEVI